MRPQRLLFIFLLLALLQTGLVLGVGLRGTNFRPFVFYSPGQSEVYEFELITGGIPDFSFTVADDSNLSQYISFDPPTLRNIRSKSTPIKIRIAFPDTPIEISPGPHVINVIVEEGIRTPGGLSAKGGVWVPITVFQVYPGKYISPSLEVEDSNENEPVTMRVRLNNWGSETITRAYAVIDIFDVFGKQVGSVQTNEVSIASRQTEMVSAVFKETAGLPAGTYRAKARIVYDDRSAEANAEFRIGSFSLTLSDYSKSFISGRISKFFITVQSGFAGRIDDVWGELMVGSERFRTESASLDAFAQGTLVGFIDATSLQPGTYPATLRVNYGGRVLEQPVSISITRLRSSGVGLSPVVIALLVGNVLLAVIIWMVIRRRRREY